MIITVAGEQKKVKDELNISELIEQEHIETPEYVTVSVNEAFLDRDQFKTTKLKEGDVVEFLYFMGGGAQKSEITGGKEDGILK